MEGNNLNGSLPDIRMPRLQIFRGSKMFTSSFTHSFANVVDAPLLEHFEVFENKIIGTIPNGFFNCSHLTFLDLSHNLFGDQLDIPNGSWTRLSQLHLNDNKFRGTLPSSLGTLSDLYYLDLRGNGFTGSLPDTISRLTNLIYFYLNGNNFDSPQCWPLYHVHLQQCETDFIKCCNATGHPPSCDNNCDSNCSSSCYPPPCPPPPPIGFTCVNGTWTASDIAISMKSPTIPSLISLQMIPSQCQSLFMETYQLYQVQQFKLETTSPFKVIPFHSIPFLHDDDVK